MSRSTELDHIGVAVRDLDNAIKFFTEVLGLELEKIEEVPEEKVRIACLKLGNTQIELLQPTDPSSPVSRFIERKGEGIHHVALRVKNIHELCRFLREKGLKLVYEEPREIRGERLINFIHPKSALGVLIEIVERR